MEQICLCGIKLLVWDDVDGQGLVNDVQSVLIEDNVPLRVHPVGSDGLHNSVVVSMDMPISIPFVVR